MKRWVGEQECTKQSASDPNWVVSTWVVIRLDLRLRGFRSSLHVARLFFLCHNWLAGDLFVYMGFRGYRVHVFLAPLIAALYVCQ
jgi:hypothetical protein